MQTTLTSKGQLTLPKAARDALGLKTGQRFEVALSKAGEVVLKPQRTDGLAVRGVLKSPHAKPLSVKEMDAGIARALAAKHGPRDR